MRHGGNRLRGTVPACLGDDLKNLQVIDFSNVNVDRTYPGPQSLEGTLPITLCNLPALVRLEFQYTQGLSKQIPNCLGLEQPFLTTVALEGNAFSGGIPESLCVPKQLVYLVLRDNDLVGGHPFMPR